LDTTSTEGDRLGFYEAIEVTGNVTVEVG